MARKGRIVRFTADDMAAKVERGESRSDWKAAEAMSREEIERLADADEGPLPANWQDSVALGVPSAKQGIYIRLDPDILQWFRADGPGYQTRIGAVLRAFVESRRDK